MKFQKGYIPWNKGTKGFQVAWNKGKKIPQFTNENHPQWKGEEAGYFAKHNWNIRHWGNPPFCELCDKVGKYITRTHNGEVQKVWSIHWANKSGKYLRGNSNDWLGLCITCHGEYDDTLIKKGEHRSRKTQIKRGQRFSPKTEIKKGQRLSRKTEFKKGIIPWNKGLKLSKVS